MIAEEAEDVRAVLADLGLDEEEQHARVIHILNKSDRLADADDRDALLNLFPDAVFTSALTGEGVDDALATIDARLGAGALDCTLVLGPGDGAARAWLHAHGKVTASAFNEDGTQSLSVEIDPANWSRFCARWPQLVGS
jgi:GTP-binding protein HflX